MSEYRIGESLPDDIITPDDPRARPRQIREADKFYVSRHGSFHRDEDEARRYGCTHQPCGVCGTVLTQRGWSKCLGCRSLAVIERWERLDRVEWDGKTPIVEIDDDRYIFNEDDLEDWFEGRDEGARQPLFVLCERVPYRLVEPDYFLDDLCCEHYEPDLPMEAEALIEKLNEVLKASVTGVWAPPNKPAAVDVSAWDPRAAIAEGDERCDWCGGTGVIRIERDGMGDRGGAVPCSRCRGEGHGEPAEGGAS